MLGAKCILCVARMRASYAPTRLRYAPMTRQWTRRLARHLHARDALSTATVLAPTSLHLSPVHGLAIFGSPALSHLHKQRSGGAAHELTRVLFHRNTLVQGKEIVEHHLLDEVPEAPLLPTRNRSLPTAHLSPALQGRCLGLALQRASPVEVRASLEAGGVADLARRTKCSVARFERFVGVLSAAVHGAPLGTAVFLAFVWSRAESKACLLRFLEALAPHQPGLFAADAAPSCEAWRQEWVGGAFEPDVHYLLGGGSVAAPPPPRELEHLLRGEVGGEAGGAAALERLCFTLVARHGCAPEVRQEQHGYRGQPEIADCVEACAREALGLALWDGARFDATRLPPSAEPAVARFFSHEATAPSAGATWFALLQARPGLHYMLGLEHGPRVGSTDSSHTIRGSGRKQGLAFSYELHPTVGNWVATLESLLRTPLTPPPPPPAAPVPLWPQCSLRWWREVGHSSLQPYVLQAATLCAPGCNPKCSMLQPYVLQAATICAPGRRADSGGGDGARRPRAARGFQRAAPLLYRAGCARNGASVAARGAKLTVHLLWLHSLWL